MHVRRMARRHARHDCLRACGQALWRALRCTRRARFSIERGGGGVPDRAFRGRGRAALLKLIMLLERPSRGRILVAGHDIGRLHASQVPYYRRQIGVVFQDHQLLSDDITSTTGAAPDDPRGHATREQARRVRAALDKVGLLRREKALPIDTLSGGSGSSAWASRVRWSTSQPCCWRSATGNLDRNSHRYHASVQRTSMATSVPR